MEDQTQRFQVRRVHVTTLRTLRKKVTSNWYQSRGKPKTMRRAKAVLASP